MDPRHVLIIEDDPALLRGLKDNLETQGYRVSAAADGQRGMDLLFREPPHLLLLDIMLPKVNGYEICKAARARGLDLPIIMLTAKGQEEDIVRGLESGADDYVTKPFGIRELLARVKAFLRRHTEQTDVYAFGDFRLDRRAHRLFRNGIEVSLTTKEFRLLDFFVRNAGRALTRDTILDGVWGNEVIVTDRSVDRCVTTLRGKIEPDHRNPACIKTIRDIGYRFEASVEPVSDSPTAAPRGPRASSGPG
jgi:DNA-binding response OmpR family regulator